MNTPIHHMWENRFSHWLLLTSKKNIWLISGCYFQWKKVSHHFPTTVSASWSFIWEWVMETVGQSVSWIIDAIILQTANQSSTSPHHLLHPPAWAMVTRVIGFIQWNNGTEECFTGKNETIIHNSNTPHCESGQAHIYSERRSEAEGGCD